MSRVTYVEEDRVRPRRRRGCTCFLLVLLALVVCVGALVAAFQFFAGEPSTVALTAPLSSNMVAANEDFSVAVTVENIGTDTLTLTGIGLDQRLLDGAEVVSVDPALGEYKERNYPLIGHWREYPVNVKIGAGDSTTYTFTLRAVNPGVYQGDVTAWVQSDLLGFKLSRAQRESLEFEVR